MAVQKKQATNTQPRSVAIYGVTKDEWDLHTALAGTLGLSIGEYFLRAAKLQWKDQLEQVRSIKDGIDLGEPAG